MKKLYKSLICFGLAIAGLFGPLVSFADGSKDLYPDGATGIRAVLRSSNTSNASWPFANEGTHYVYANIGETITLASSAQGSGNARIRLYAPDGTLVVNATSGGQIANRTAEVAGPQRVGQTGGNRYTPLYHTVNQAGIYRVEFVARGTGAPNSAIDVASWTQGSNAGIVAWDVSVINEGNTDFISGRVYTNILNFSLGSSRSGTNGFNGLIYVLTKDGYVYRVNGNGMNGLYFTFFVNNLGFVDPDTQEPVYKSLTSSTTTFLDGRVQNPNNADAGNHITHKLFYTEPAADLPPSANGAVPGTGTWLKNEPIAPNVSNVEVTGVDGTPGQVSNKGGYISFTAGAQGQYVVEIESPDDTFTKRVLRGSAVAGLNNVFWDGTDGDGNSLPEGSVPTTITVQLQGAEVHFPYFDVEYNPNGIVIELLGAPSPNDLVYWDDTDLPTSGAPSPRNNSHLPPTSSTGISSNSNGHIFGDNFGDNRSLDTWTFILGEKETISTDVVVNIADLSITEVSPDKTQVLVGDELTYTVKVFNDGPSDVTSAPFTFTVPLGFDPTGFTPTFSDAGCGTQATVISFDVASNTFSSTLNLPDGCEVTYTFTGTVTSEMVAGDMVVEATIMRPNDVTDPDATNQDPNTPPTDPYFECEDNGQGGVCNNIMPNATVTFVAPLTAAKTIVGNPSAVKPGDVITYQITIMNPNPETAVTGVIVTDEVPGELTDVTNSTPAGTFADGTIIWTGLTVPAGDELIVSFQATVRDDVPASTTNFQNIATVTDPNYPDDPITPSVNVNIDIPAFTLLKAIASVTDADDAIRADGAFVAVGDKINYTITVTNTGNVTLYNIEVGDPLTGLAETIAELAPGDDPVVLTTTHTVDQDDLDNGSVLNTASAAGEDPNGDPVDPEDPDDGGVTTPGTQNPAFTLVKSVASVTDADDAIRADGAFVAVGDKINYTITVTNTGNVTLYNIEVGDPLTGLAETIAELAPGDDPVVLTTTHTVDQDDLDNGSVLNTATANGEDPDGDPVDPEDPDDGGVTTPGMQNPSLSFAKTGMLSANGSTVGYTFTVTNTGNVTMTGITLDETDFSGTGTAPVPTFVSNSGSSPEGTLVPGEEATYTASYTLTQADKDAGGVENLATVTGTPPTTDPDDPAEPIAPVPSTPDIDNPGTPGHPGEPTVVDVPADPALSFAKTGVLSTDGNTVTYTFTVTNTGNVTMAGITVSDPKISDPIVLDETTLAPGENTTGTATYTITQDEKDAGEVENLATVTGTPPTTDPDDPAEPIAPVPSTPDIDNPGTPGHPGEPTVVDVPADPALSFAKTGVLSTDGNTVTYTFTVTNTGNVTMTGIEVTDGKLPDGVTLDATELAPGEVATGTATYIIAQAEKDAGEVRNEATVTGTPPTTDPGHPAVPLTPVPSTPDPNNPGDPNTPGEETIVDIPTVPSLAFVKEADITGLGDPVVAGDEITYTFTVTNTGNVTLTDITLSEASFSGTGTVPAFGFVTNSGSSPEGTLAPGEVATYRFTYVLTQADMDAGGIENLATVTGTPPTTDPGNPAVPITPVPSTPDRDNPGTPGDPGIPTVVEVPNNPNLDFIKEVALTRDNDDNNEVSLDDELTYTFMVTNTGNVTLTGITIMDTDLTGLGTLNYTWPDAGNAGVLLPGESLIATAAYTVAQTDVDKGNVSNQAVVDANDPDGDPVGPVKSGNNPSDPGTPGNPGDPTEIHVPQHPELSVTKEITSSGPYHTVGQLITYDIVMTNTGNVTIDNIRLTDDNAEIPAGQEQIGTLAPGASKTVTVAHEITQADLDEGSVSNQATVTGEDPNGEPVTIDSDDPTTPDPNDPTDTNLDQRPSITVTKSARDGNYAQVGDVITYDITVRNAGNITLSDIVITDDNADAGSLTPATIAALAPNETANVTATHTITQADVDAGYVYNSAKATGNTPDGDPIDDDSHDPNPKDPDAPVDPTCPDCTITPVQAAAAVALVKEVSNSGTGQNGLFIVGDEIVYTFTIHNTGNVSLSNFRLTDAKLGLQDVLISGTLSPGNSLTYQAGYTVTQADINTGEIVNTATIQADTPDGDTVSDVSGTDTGNDTPTVVLAAESPESVDDPVSTPQNTPITIDVLDNDREGSSPLDPSTVHLIDPETGEHTKEVTIPGEGTYTVGADGRVTFTPEREFSGESSIRYVVSDVNGLTSGPATITVTAVRSQPQAVDDHAETTFNTSVRIPVLGNDEEGGAPLDPATIELVDQPRFGTVVINSDGTVTYTPNQYYTGTDSFTYRVRDANGNWTNVATVHITVSGFQIPNVITPNGDGQNDRFVIIGLENYDNAEVTIFNRWGNQIYRSANYKQDWAGQGVNEGTYYYLITLRKDGRETVHKGWVLVKRN